MILVKNALSGFTCKFSTVLIIISILYAANGNSIEYLDAPESVESSAASSSFDHSENAVEDDDDYPSEILEEIVKETYTLLKSDDNEGKRKLKIRPSHYNYYLHAPRIAEPANISSRWKSGKSIRYFQEGCPAKNTLVQPKRRPDDSGTKYIIVNVDNFKQYVNVSRCVDGNHSCGNRFTGPILYESKCEQHTDRVGLISIPAGKELVKENQEIHYFPFPTKCICKSKRIRESESKKKESRSL